MRNVLLSLSSLLFLALMLVSTGCSNDDEVRSNDDEVRTVLFEAYEYQPFLKEGKVWNVTRWSPERETSKEVTFIVKGDTIIGDKQYKKFFEEDKYIYALREDGKKIYAVSRTDKYGNPNTSEKLWYDFNVNEGDVLEMEMSYMHVKKIDYIVVNGVKRKCFYLFETDKNFPEDGHADGLWIEGWSSETDFRLTPAPRVNDQRWDTKPV